MDFWALYQDFVFLVTLVAAEVPILRRFGRKPHFPLRFVLGLLPAAVLSYFTIEYFHASMWLMATRYVIAFFATFFFMAVAYKGDLWAYLFAGTMAYCAQHIAYQCHDLVFVLVRGPHSRPGLPQALLLAASCILIYGGIYLVFVRYIKIGEPVRINNRVQAMLSTVILVITAYISFCGILETFAIKSQFLRIIILLFGILSCFLGLMLEMSFVQLKQNETELSVLRLMVRQAKYQYKESKESIELINIKCHDLRHQMHRLAQSMDREELDRLAQAIDIYDASLATGNDALDIVLMDKGLRCREKGIRLTCMFDADIVKNVSYSDIYSLFGNAIENAMESVECLEEDRRSISVVGYKQAGLSVIRIENYCQGEILFEDGLPVTQKSKDCHGFGVKSIRLVAQRYGGELFMCQTGDIFQMELVFPTQYPTRTA